MEGHGGEERDGGRAHRSVDPQSRGKRRFNGERGARARAHTVARELVRTGFKRYSVTFPSSAAGNGGYFPSARESLGDHACGVKCPHLLLDDTGFWTGVRLDGHGGQPTTIEWLVRP
jgi:hypothetical protein